MTATWIALAIAPNVAHAHLVTSGAGPFYDGVAHFFVSPADVAVAVALALFGGLSGRQAARWLVILLPAVWMLGIVLGIRSPDLAAGGAWISGASMLVAGLLLAVKPNWPAPATAGIGVAIALVHGLLNGQAMATTDTSLLAGGGIVVAVGLVILLLGALATSLTAAWQRTTARVLGSWVAAIGILSLAWSFRPPG